MAVQWEQSITGHWNLTDGDVRLKGPQSAPDDDGLPRVLSAYVQGDPMEGLFAALGSGGQGQGAWTNAELALDRRLSALGNGGSGGLFGRRNWPDWMPDWLKELLDYIAKLWDDLVKAVDDMVKKGKAALLYAALALLAILVISRR